MVSVSGWWLVKELFISGSFFLFLSLFFCSLPCHCERTHGKPVILLCHPGACSGPAKMKFLWVMSPGPRSFFFLVIASGRVAIQLMHYYNKAKFTGLPRSLHSLAMTKEYKKCPKWDIFLLNQFPTGKCIPWFNWVWGW